jgi:predicted TIM-barrel enzyme
MPGWQTPTTNAKSYYDLPKKARDYVEVRMKVEAHMANNVADLEQYIEKFVGVKVRWNTCCQSWQLLTSHRSSTLALAPNVRP